jgi:ACS family hexuronate transporter-like MFS transporter
MCFIMIDDQSEVKRFFNMIFAEWYSWTERKKRMSDSTQTNKQAGRSTLMMGMLMIAVFFSMGSRAIFSPIMPALQSELHISLATAGTLFLFISISYAAAMLFCGFLTVRVGHGLTIVAALALIAAGLFFSAIAAGIVLLSIGMIFIGAGAGAYPPSGLAMINRKIRPEGRTIAFALHEISPNLALLLAPLIVLVAEPWVGWRGVLLAMAAVCGAATLAFWRWGISDSGVGAAPKLSTIGIILRMRNTYMGMILLSAAAAGLQGVYAILPAYLVAQSSHSIEYVNVLLTASRVVSIVFLLCSGMIVRRIGKRNTMIVALLFTSACTGLIGFLDGTFLDVIIVAQPALIAGMIPPFLASIGDIGDSEYQNITYGVIITVGISVGGGVVPSLLGIFGDLGLGWLGFVSLAGFMLAAAIMLLATPRFGQD